MIDNEDYLESYEDWMQVKTDIEDALRWNAIIAPFMFPASERKIRVSKPDWKTINREGRKR